jgi:WD40 repeat protein
LLLTGDYLFASIAWSPDGKWIAAHGGDSRSYVVTVWDASLGKQTLALRGRPREREVWRNLAWSPDSKRLAFAVDGKPRVYDIFTGKEAFALSGPPLTVPVPYDFFSWVAWSRGGTLLGAATNGMKVWGAATKEVKVWDVTTGQPIFTQSGRSASEGVLKIAFSPDARRLAVIGPRAGEIFDLASGEEVVTLRGFHQSFQDVLEDDRSANRDTHPTEAVWSPDGRRLTERAVWDTRSGDMVVPPDVLRCEPLGMSGTRPGIPKYSPDGSRLAINVGGGDIEVLDLRPPPE